MFSIWVINMARMYELVLAEIPFGSSDDNRPGVIIAVRIDGLTVVGGTAHQDLWHVDDFIVYEDDPQFAETKLKRATAFNVRIIEIEYGKVVKRLGVFQGDLAHRFAKWFGDK